MSATHQTTAPAAEGKANAGAVQTPTWSRVAEPTGDLLDLIAEQNPATPTEIDEWDHFKAVLAEVGRATGLIDQNVVRPLLRGEIKPQRIGAFYHRAAKAGLIRAEGWTTSDDREGKNGGRPCRSYRYLGT